MTAERHNCAFLAFSGTAPTLAELTQDCYRLYYQTKAGYILLDAKLLYDHTRPWLPAMMPFRESVGVLRKFVQKLQARGMYVGAHLNVRHLFPRDPNGRKLKDLVAVVGFDGVFFDGYEYRLEGETDADWQTTWGPRNRTACFEVLDTMPVRPARIETSGVPPLVDFNTVAGYTDPHRISSQVEKEIAWRVAHQFVPGIMGNVGWLAPYVAGTGHHLAYDPVAWEQAAALACRHRCTATWQFPVGQLPWSDSVFTATLRGIARWEPLRQLAVSEPAAVVNVPDLPAGALGWIKTPWNDMVVVFECPYIGGNLPVKAVAGFVDYQKGSVVYIWPTNGPIEIIVGSRLQPLTCRVVDVHGRAVPDTLSGSRLTLDRPLYIYTRARGHSYPRDVALALQFARRVP